MPGTTTSPPTIQRRRGQGFSPATLERRRRMRQTIEARRDLSARGGRIWVNGVEIGGANPRFAHLDRSYD